MSQSSAMNDSEKASCNTKVPPTLTCLGHRLKPHVRLSVVNMQTKYHKYINEGLGYGHMTVNMQMSIMETQVNGMDIQMRGESGQIKGLWYANENHGHAK